MDGMFLKRNNMLIRWTEPESFDYKNQLTAALIYCTELAPTSTGPVSSLKTH